MNIQWYPGHMTKTRRMMEENISLVDIVIELLDARLPFSSKNPEIDNLARNKKRIVILNKVDLADEKKTKEWRAYFEDKGFKVIEVNSITGKGIKDITEVSKELMAEKLERLRLRGRLFTPTRAMIVGIPNVGKSTLINKFVGKALAKTGDKAGVTRGKQWVRVKRDFELLDTPGILWPKFEDQTVGQHLAFIGSIKDELIQSVELALDLIEFLTASYPGILGKTYSVDESEDSIAILNAIAVNCGCLKKGNELDHDKAAFLLLDDFRNARLGKISVENPQDGENNGN